jgi:predicted O-methyltransferase YrrM
MVIATLRKANQLLSLLKDRPIEVYDRLHMQASDLWQFYRTPERVPQNQKCSWREILTGVSAAIGESLERYLEESGLNEVRDQIQRRMDEKLAAPPFMLRFNGDRHLAELCYLACRAMKPSMVVETGVAYGVSSAYILQALKLNGRGVLHSVDLPPLSVSSKEKEHFIGILIPEPLKGRWELHRGISGRVLPRILAQIEDVDIACLDSRSSYKVKYDDLSILGRYLAHPGLMIVDDVERTSAFHDWTKTFSPDFAAASLEMDKDNYFGVAVNAHLREADRNIVPGSPR